MFKNPLSTMTNEELVELYQTSVSNYVKDDVLAQLLKNMEGIMVQIADRYRNIPNIDWIDRMGELQIALLKAVKGYDSGKGNKFTTVCRAYFIQAMDKQYEIQTREKRYNPEIKTASYEVLTELNKDGQGEEIEIEADVNNYADVELHYLLENLKLSEREYKVCVMLSMGENKIDIARAIGVSSTMINKYIKKIKCQMIAGGVI